MSTNKQVEISFPQFPQTYEAFIACPQANMQTPFDTVAMTIVALSMYPIDSAMSLRMLDYLRGPRPLNGIEKQFIQDRFRDKDYVPRSYFVGATPANTYTPTEPRRLIVFENPYSYQEENYANLYVTSSGADSPRAVKCRLAKDGKWYLWEQYLLSGIRVPESEDPWA